MADFIKLPVVDELSVSNNGSPFKDSAWLFATALGGQGMYIATDNGTVYAARVGSYLYIVCIGYGYFAYTWFAGTNFTRKWEVAKTDWTSIYTVQTLSVTGTWVAELTEFETESEMLERFYDTIVFPGVTPLSGDITVLLNPKSGYSEINVDLPINIAGADTIIVSGKSSTIDPNNSGGNSGESVPSGNFDDSSDPIPISSLPTFSAANSGLLTLFRPSLSQLQALGEYLWTNITDIPDNLKKLFSNPMDYFIAFHIVPVVPDVGESRVIKLGLWSTQVSMPPVTSQWYEADCGTVAVPPYWGSALDYAPYTKITAFLPFIGSVSLNADEVMGKTIGLKYRIDLLSGQCVAILSIDGDALYQFTGQCSVSVPLTGADWSRVYSAAIGATTALVAGVAGVAGATGVSMAGQTNAAAEAAMGAGMAGTAFADLSTAAKGVKGVVAMREEMLKAAQSANAATTQMAASGVRKSAAVQAAAASYGVSNVAGNVMSAKPTVQHAGSVSGAAGFLGIRKPYIYIEFPNQSLAENYKHFVGYPSNMFAKLSTLSGFTQCESVIVKGINATDDEIAEITEGLKAGVYL